MKKKILCLLSFFLICCSQKKNNKDIKSHNVKSDFFNEECDIDLKNIKIESFPSIKKSEIKKFEVRNLEFTSESLDNGYEINSISFDADPKVEYAKYCHSLEDDSKSCSDSSSGWIKLNSFGTLNTIDKKFLNTVSYFYLKLCSTNENKEEMCHKKIKRISFFEDTSKNKKELDAKYQDILDEEEKLFRTMQEAQQFAKKYIDKQDDLKLSNSSDDDVSSQKNLLLKVGKNIYSKGAYRLTRELMYTNDEYLKADGYQLTSEKYCLEQINKNTENTSDTNSFSLAESNSSSNNTKDSMQNHDPNNQDFKSNSASKGMSLNKKKERAILIFLGISFIAFGIGLKVGFRNLAVGSLMFKSRIFIWTDNVFTEIPESKLRQNFGTAFIASGIIAFIVGLTSYNLTKEKYLDQNDIDFYEKMSDLSLEAEKI